MDSKLIPSIYWNARDTKEFLLMYFNEQWTANEYDCENMARKFRGCGLLIYAETLEGWRRLYGDDLGLLLYTHVQWILSTPYLYRQANIPDEMLDYLRGERSQIHQQQILQLLQDTKTRMFTNRQIIYLLLAILISFILQMYLAVGLTFLGMPSGFAWWWWLLPIPALGLLSAFVVQAIQIENGQYGWFRWF